MTKPKLIMMKGLPASGKSTWAKKQVDDHGFKRVNKDDLRSMIDNGKWSKSNEKLVVQVQTQMIESFLKAGHSVVVDDTNFHPPYEEKYKMLAAVYGADFEVQDFSHVSLEECLARDKKRPNYVGEEVIKRMYRQYLESPAPKFVLERNENLTDCIIVDIDGTIANNTGVRGWFEWDKVYLDATYDHILTIINHLLNPQAFKIFFFSGREGTEVCIKETERWIKDKVIDKYYFIRSSIHQHGFNLVMRQEKDHRKDAIVKKEMFDAYIANKHNVLAVFDDRNQVVEMWRSLGLPTLQCNEGDF